MFFDGHEREDVVKEKKVFLDNMVEIGFLHPSEVPTPQAASAFPSSITLPTLEVREKTVVIFHDESTLQANEDQTKMWGKKEHILRLKSKGSGIMVSDFVEEKMDIWHSLMMTSREHQKQIGHFGRRLVPCLNMENQEKDIGLAPKRRRMEISVGF